MAEPDREIAESQNRSIDFRRAFQQLENEEYIPAGESFYTYYKTAPAGDPDLPTALYNAAVSYKLGDRPKTAVSLFKEFTQSKDPAFLERFITRFLANHDQANAPSTLSVANLIQPLAPLSSGSVSLGASTILGLATQRR